MRHRLVWMWCALVASIWGRGAAAVVFDQQNFPHVAFPAPVGTDLANLPGDLRGVSIPDPSNITDFVKDRTAAIRLGKALFWDMQVGSDGIQACASCHFRAGADPRSKNQLSPGLKHVPTPDLTFKTGGLNYQLRASDFPFTRLAVPGVRGALDPLTDSNDVASSQGVHHLLFSRFVALPDPDGFRIGTKNTRRVEPRNTPSVINAVFNHRQFWDGRANDTFNGVNHVGQRDPTVMVVRAPTPGTPMEVHADIDHASLASQAAAPIVSPFEMAEPGRTQLDFGRELAGTGLFFGLNAVRPLALQRVHPTDSVLGALSRWPFPGLRVSSYDQMVKDAFQDQWWNSSKLVRVAADGTRSFVDHPDGNPRTSEYTLIQYNFVLFFGLAVQMYEATLVSDDTPWDRFRRQHPDAADPALNPWTNTAPDNISRLALFGATIFNDRTRGPTNVRCSNCHEQAELTDASTRRVVAAVPNGPVRNRDGNVIDKGFNNIGVRPTADDLGVGATDAFGPLSKSKQRFGDTLPPSPFDGAAVTSFGVEGAFKVPSLRNVALTAPYFHNGDALTLRQVVEFYSRGGSVAPIQQFSDGAVISPLGIPVLTDAEIDALVAFMEALTDERVRLQKAPFDHPQLFVPNGHPGNQVVTTDFNRDGEADDLFAEVSAVGAGGSAELPGFLAFGRP
jgi:cytochrome c peroxidase